MKSAETVQVSPKKRSSITSLVAVLALCSPIAGFLAIAVWSNLDKGAGALFAAVVGMLLLFLTVPIAVLVAIVASLRRNKRPLHVVLMWIVIVLTVLLLFLTKVA